ncbi:MAG: 4-alpha-glucanotransferase [Anaerolineae bacterium]
MFDLGRCSGILLHPTSLPGPYGIGDLGPDAVRWLDLLHETGQRAWQVMPLGPTGFGDSPYQALSAFAGNPLLISPQRLTEAGLLPASALEGAPAFPADQLDYSAVIPWKHQLLRTSFDHFRRSAGHGPQQAFEHFCQAEAGWLDDYALFMALKARFNGQRWDLWPDEWRSSQPEALAVLDESLRDEIRYHQYVQWLFSEQWAEIRRQAHGRNIAIIGDLPIFVAYDSADVWAHPDLFCLDGERRPTLVAGVPPDYFSPEGQLWGNPLYDWDRLVETGFHWWVERFRRLLQMVDIIRIDHFRGFQACWAVPAGAESARGGQWIEVPGDALFASLRDALGDLPVIAEDLGLITPEVEALRDRWGFPGMKVLQFAFGDGADHPYLPHNHVPHCVVYTGTHDNDTTLGWYRTAPPEVQDHVRRYFDRDGSDVAWDLIRAALSSVAEMAIIPMQDVMALGSEARMNTPGRSSGNWTWRFRWEQIEPWMTERLRSMTQLYGRFPST